jgi:hypothetical protein
MNFILQLHQPAHLQGGHLDGIELAAKRYKLIGVEHGKN